MATLTPHLWFDTEAKAAAEFYAAVIPDSKILNTVSIDNTPSGTIDIINMEILGQRVDMLSAGPTFKLSEAFSFIIRCDTQEEIDYFWEKLSAVPEAEACGWCKDQFGVSWQIVPSNMDKIMTTGDKEKSGKIMQALLAMKKLDIAALEAAGEQE